jgi:hypothetical protein
MASFYLGINRGKGFGLNNVTATTTLGTSDFEFRMDTGKSSTKADAILALEILEAYIESNGVGGAGAGVDLPPL